MIAENIYQQVDSNGYISSTIDCIVDYSRDSNAITKSDKYVTIKSGNGDSWSDIVMLERNGHH